MAETGSKPKRSNGRAVVPRTSTRALTAVATLERYGIDKILERYAAGETLAEIAKTTNVSAWSLHEFVNREEHAQDYLRAREMQAEAWAALGKAALDLPEDKIDGPRVNLARYKEAHYRWRAGIANARYSERQQVELTGANGGPIQQAVVVYMPANARDEKVIDHE